MPSTLANIIAAEISVRYKAPLVTQALNRQNVIAGHGVYRGYRLGASASALTVEVTSETGVHDAVVRTLDGFGLSIRQSGTMSLSLAAYASKTVVVALYADYAAGYDTFGQIRAYELSPTDEYTVASEKDELVVLGTVEVPASGVIAAADITPDKRSYAWEGMYPSAARWASVLKNGSFDLGSDVLSENGVPFWSEVSASGAAWDVSTTYKNRGPQALVLDYTSGVSTCSAVQEMHMPIIAGKELRVKAAIRLLEVPTVGNLYLKLSFGDISGAVNTDESYVFDLSMIDASFREIEWTYRIPSGDDSTLLKLEFVNQGLSFTGGAGVKLALDNVQIFREEVDSYGDAYAGTNMGPQWASELTLQGAGAEYSGIAPRLTFDRSTPSYSEGTLNIGRKDGVTGHVSDMPPFLKTDGLLSVGDDMLSTDAKKVRPRLQTDHDSSTSHYTLVQESVDQNNADGKAWRVYVQNGKWFRTWNARYIGHLGGSSWSSDGAGDAFYIGTELVWQISYHLASGAGDTWSTWDDIMLTSGVGAFQFLKPSTTDELTLYTTQGASTQDTTKAFYRNQRVSVHGVVTTGASPVVVDGIGIASVVTSGADILLTYAAPFSSTPTVVVTSNSSMTTVVVPAAANCSISAYDLTGSPIDLSLSVRQFSIMVCGRE